MKLKKSVALLFVNFYILTSVLVCFGNVSMVSAAENTSGIVADGDLDEWDAIEALSSSDSEIAEWKIAKSEDGTKLYFCFSGVANNIWHTAYQWKSLTVTNESGSSVTCLMSCLQDSWICSGSVVTMVNNASGGNPGPYAVECILPITGDLAGISFAGKVVKMQDIPVFVPAEEKVAVYEGITIDGDFDDWDAITKYPAECPEEANHSFDCLDAAACVFDGDYVYLYIKDGSDSCAALAGTHTNGRFSITTDTGRRLVFQVTTADGGSVSGVNGAKVKYYGKEWEIAVPVSALPEYYNKVSFGLYQQEPFVSDVVNLQDPEGSGSAGEFNGIVYDGLFGDWDAYPHTLIEYATAGTQTNYPDGEGALYLDGGYLYGHVVSSMDAHLAEQGGEFGSAISIYFNGEYEYNGSKTNNLYPRLVTVAEDGTINWCPQIYNLPNGQYRFFIADGRGEYNTVLQTNISHLAEHEKFFGEMLVTVSDFNDEMEFKIDLEQVAKFHSYYSGTTIEASEYKLVEAQFGRIGDKILSASGASSGPYMGIGMGIAIVAFAMIKNKRGRTVE